MKHYGLKELNKKLVKKFGEDFNKPPALFEEGSYFTHIATGDEKSKWGKLSGPCHGDIVKSKKIKGGWILEVWVKESD